MTVIICDRNNWLGGRGADRNRAMSADILVHVVAGTKAELETSVTIEWWTVMTGGGFTSAFASSAEWNWKECLVVVKSEKNTQF